MGLSICLSDDCKIKVLGRTYDTKLIMYVAVNIC